MGSVRFLSVNPTRRGLGEVLAEAEYVDEDGVPVLIAINADKSGNLYELDFWKVDFSPLRRYPMASELKIKA